jgi:hypothetical protein
MSIIVVILVDINLKTKGKMSKEMEVEVHIEAKALAHNQARFTVTIESDGSEVSLSEETARTVVDAMNKTIEEELVKEYKEEAYIPPHKIEEPFCKALMENKLPMPDGIENEREAIDYVKSVYGIHGEHAALFDEVIIGMLNHKERMRGEIHEMKVDLKKAICDELNFIDTNKWKMRFDIEEQAVAAIMSGSKDEIPSAKSIRYNIPDDEVYERIMELGWESMSGEMHKNREALDKHDETTKWTDKEGSKISSKPDGLSEDISPSLAESVLNSVLLGLSAETREEAQRAANMFLNTLAKEGKLSEDDFELYASANNLGDSTETKTLVEHMHKFNSMLPVDKQRPMAKCQECDSASEIPAFKVIQDVYCEACFIKRVEKKAVFDVNHN